ncbi:hypothetical protein E5676_scaffold529G00150 [Cucumis melo var. makuwa]|uniref:Uncharacterized protein n=1 Tax=Cucumis melo var. makuwa TaxID=1194695 RepID=A0A5A7SZ52_CUCMM|nr:hypothetical protein E6C27_scaffold56G00700 [Cucumis melo var. makuwa]TYK19058.1 hypothetical protein E5676_scaffold529G00150 [Cucumis melo var. makuwa]
MNVRLNIQLVDVTPRPTVTLCIHVEASLQDTGVLPMPKNVGENEKYVRKGYPDVHHGVGKNVERKASGEAFSTPY